MGIKQASVIDRLVADRVCTHRKKFGLTQSQLAGKLGVTFQQVQKYEKGINRIGAGRLFQMATLFNVPIQALYPQPGTSAPPAERQSEEIKVVSDFVTSAEGLQLCLSFLRIKDQQQRKKIIALVQELAGSILEARHRQDRTAATTDSEGGAASDDVTAPGRP